MDANLEHASRLDSLQGQLAQAAARLPLRARFSLYLASWLLHNVGQGDGVNRAHRSKFVRNRCWRKSRFFQKNQWPIAIWRRADPDMTVWATQRVFGLITQRLAPATKKYEC